jgi:hypothetical protein
MAEGVTINRPPRDGKWRSCVARQHPGELLQKGDRCRSGAMVFDAEYRRLVRPCLPELAIRREVAGLDLAVGILNTTLRPSRFT